MLFCFLVSPTVHISICFSLFIPNKMTYLLHSNQLLLNQITNVHPLSINSITYLIDSYQLLFNQIINFAIQFISFLLALYYIYSLYICHSSVWFMVFIYGIHFLKKCFIAILFHSIWLDQLNILLNSIRFFLTNQFLCVLYGNTFCKMSIWKLNRIHILLNQLMHQSSKCKFN